MRPVDELVVPRVVEIRYPPGHRSPPILQPEDVRIFLPAQRPAPLPPPAERLFEERRQARKAAFARTLRRPVAP